MPSITPNADETQPRFAIRFHEAMRDEIPDVYERNRACDDAWEQSRGAMPERNQARRQFPPDKYSECRDVNIFCEHRVSDSRTPDGQIISGNYDRYALAEMVDAMNGRIRDTDDFTPLSLGHTENGKPDPDLLGYAGGFRLGMIGREKPRYAIFTDEYRRNDREAEFRALPGRSPEVWKYPRFRDRFMAPIACLRTKTPRLDLVPSHYERATLTDGTDVLVDRYSRSHDGTTFDEDVQIDRYMSALGSSNAFMPQPSAIDDYGMNGGQDGRLAEQIYQLLIQSQPMQWVLNQMAQETPPTASPLVQQGVEQGPTSPTGASPMTDPATPQAPPATPADATRQPPEQYSRTHLDEIIRQNRLILAENESLRNQVASLQADRDTQHYSRQLSELATTRQLNQSAELERLMAMPTAEARDAHLGVIRDCYARTVVGADAGMNFSRPDPDTREGADRDVYQRDGSLTQAASDAVMAICGREGVSWDEGKAKYLSSRTTASA